MLGSPLLGFISCATPEEKEQIAKKIFDGIENAGDALDVFDFEKLAQHKLPSAHYGYLATGVDGDRTLLANREAFDKVKLKMRRLIDPTQVDMSTTLFGKQWSSPIVLSPGEQSESFSPGW